MIALALSPLLNCATPAPRAPERANSLALVEISGGLPQVGQWREHIALADMDGDGSLDIVAPPPRNAEPGKNVPHIFLRDEKEKVWKEGVFTFPSLKGYGYGGIGVADINEDSYPDIILAVHEGEIILLENTLSSGFVERTFPVKDIFHSRMVEVNDINGDGRQDIVALLEASFSPKSRSRAKNGILIGLNKGGNEWDVETLEGSSGLFGDSMAMGDIKGEGKKDIIIAPLTGVDKGVVWFGDGKGNFKAYEGNLLGDKVMAFSVSSGDLDGDGKDEVVFKVSGYSENAKTFLSAYKWDGAGFTDISKGLETVENPIVFDLADVDGNGKKELIVLSDKGISIYKYTGTGWVESGYYQLPSAETFGASDLRAGRNRDGSLLIVYARGSQGPDNVGIKAYQLR